MKPLSYLEISRDALLYNVAALKELILTRAADTKWEWVPKFAAVVKADAYGHGLETVVKTLDGHVDRFQVDDLDELRRIRQFTKTPVLVFGHIPLTEIPEAISLNAEISIYDRAQLAPLKITKNPRFSVKVDALLGRLGLLPDEIDGFIEALSEAGLTPQAVYAHYANIEDTTDLTHADDQLALFRASADKFAARWPGIGRHISATSGLLAHEDPRQGASMVRMGIGLYGLYPSAPLGRSHASLELKPALRWVSHLAQVKRLPAGHPVGYGLTYRTGRPTTIGIVPQGYSDGYDRGLSNVGEVLVHGRRCPVIGRIAMNMFAIDLTPTSDARLEDEVILLGDQGEDRITAEEIALKLGTINYEVVARVSPLLPRITKE